MGERLRELTERAVWSASSTELSDLVSAAHRLVAQAQALQLATVRQADLRDLAKSVNATSTTNWLAGKLRMRPADASKLVKLSTHLDADLPEAQAALAAGDISLQHAHVISFAVRELPKEAATLDVRASVDRTLTEQAQTFDPNVLARLGRHVLHTIDPELSDRLLKAKLERDEAKALAERSLRISPDPYSGSAFVRGKLDAYTAETLRQLLEPLAIPKNTAEGRDLRLADRRLADAFAELIDRVHDLDLTASHGGNRTQVVVLLPAEAIDPATGTGVGTTLDSGLEISPTLMAQLMCECERAYVAPTFDVPGDLHYTDPERIFTKKLRRVLQVRDHGCAFPGCDRRPAWCHAHHIVPWSKGGKTTKDNGVLLCGHHHRVVHQGDWLVRMAADGYPEFIPPEWIDQQRRPLRNTLHRRQLSI